MHTWPLQDAKSHFSELVSRSLSEGPQLVTRHGQEAVVVLAAASYRSLIQRPSLMSVLNAAPRGEALDISRPTDMPRPLDW